MHKRLLQHAFDLKQRYQLPYRDAALIAAARALEASVLYSEDFYRGQDYVGVKIENPFRS